MCLHRRTIWEAQDEICTDCGLILCTDVYRALSPIAVESESEEDSAYSPAGAASSLGRG
jgi:hypothetical protein